LGFETSVLWKTALPPTDYKQKNGIVPTQRKKVEETLHTLTISTVAKPSFSFISATTILKPTHIRGKKQNMDPQKEAQTLWHPP
jgi:hypothetical protein